MQMIVLIMRCPKSEDLIKTRREPVGELEEDRWRWAPESLRYYVMRI